eukprot:6061-Rhodomonas_salina.2
MTDVEGNLDYFHNYVAISKVLKWSDDNKDALDFLNEHDQFVFGGDSQVCWSGHSAFVSCERSALTDALLVRSGAS